MFDKYVIVDKSLRNEKSGSRIDAYSVNLRIPYYRGLGLSMVTVRLVVDGLAVDPREMTFSVHGRSYRVEDMPDVLDDRWPFTEAATVTVARPGGLAVGDHEVEAQIHLRVSYVTNGFGATDTKTLALIEPRER